MLIFVFKDKICGFFTGPGFVVVWCVCVCVFVWQCVCVSQQWSSGPFLWPIVSQCFPVCLPGEAACFSLRCQFGCQMERGGAVRCLCPPGLHLAADNKTCEGSAFTETPLSFSLWWITTETRLTCLDLVLFLVLFNLMVIMKCHLCSLYYSVWHHVHVLKRVVIQPTNN